MNTAPTGGARSDLERVGALIQSGDFPKAEAQLVQTLAEAPADLRTLKLLALVRFKLGRLAEARETYQALAKTAPDDAGVHLNLGLIALKLDWIDEAITELEAATQLRPDETKAWNYLGFAYARGHRKEAAAEAFRRCGREDLARVALTGVAMGAPADGVSGPADPAGVFAKAATNPAKPALAGARIPGDFTLVEGFAPAASPVAAGAFADPAGINLPDFVLARLLPDPDAPDATFPTGVFTRQGEVLRFNLAGEAVVQSQILLAAQGKLAITQAERREHGRQVDRPLGDEQAPFFTCRGHGSLWLSGLEGRRLAVMRLEEDVMFVRQDRLAAFADDIVWEAGRLPMDGLPLLQLRGSGRVVLSANPDHVVAIKVSQETTGGSSWIERDRLLGWVGRVVPHRPGVGGAGRLLLCEGEGIVLVLRHRNA